MLYAGQMSFAPFCQGEMADMAAEWHGKFSLTMMAAAAMAEMA
jgi:hypothetical protein